MLSYADLETGTRAVASVTGSRRGTSRRLRQTSITRGYSMSETWEEASQMALLQSCSRGAARVSMARDDTYWKDNTCERA
jgi:hypothetical protein